MLVKTLNNGNHIIIQHHIISLMIQILFLILCLVQLVLLI